MLQRILLAVLAISLSGCAWLTPNAPGIEIIKPIPVGGYEELSTRIHYPKSIREMGIEGTVTVKVFVSAEGEVLETRVSQSLQHELDQIAENAVKRTRFVPATQAGLPVRVWITIPFVFALESWEEKASPFKTFEMKVYPDQSYQSFRVNMTGEMKTEMRYPLRFELLIPFNAEKAWIARGDTNYYPQRVTDNNGEWLIFQVQNETFDLNFNYEPLPGMTAKAFQYKFLLNHALPDWKLSIIYEPGGLKFKMPPDHEDDLEGLRRYSYDLKFQEAFEARFLEVALLE